MERDTALSIEDLQEQSGVPIRTIRFYIAEGLLPGPGARGRSAAYGEDHLARLRLIRHLAGQHVPLGTIRQRLEGIRPDEIRALLTEVEQGRRDLAEVERKPSPREYISALLSQARLTSAEPAPRPPAPADSSLPAHEEWRRWELAPGVELHVRADAYQRHEALIRRLLRAVRGR